MEFMSVYPNKPLTLGYILKDILIICLCSVLIAILFMMVTSKEITLKTFFEYFLIAQCMGLSIGVPCTLAFQYFKPERKISQLLLLTLCVILGSIMGSYIASHLIDHKFSAFKGQVPPQMIIVGTILGFTISFGFIIYEKYIAFKLSASEEKFKRTVLEKEKLNADLKLLQAQVEPHFLFNTLSNILSLLEHDPDTGKKMLENLTRYLRTSLIQSRKPFNRLGDEIDMIGTYLSIYSIRMGKRLAYDIDVPQTLWDIEIPPMILQPLVENAIKHGIEPKIQGGRIFIRARLEKGLLILEIEDTGMGIKEKSATGVGTGNIRKRLASLFGDRAGLMFEDMTPEGLKAIVEIPCETHHSHHSG